MLTLFFVTAAFIFKLNLGIATKYTQIAVQCIEFA